MRRNKSNTISTWILCGLLFSSASTNAAKRMSDTLTSAKPPTASPAVTASSESLVQLAILLDTSGSMEGLIDQARCQVWNAVSRLATAERDGTPVRLQIAVYQFGTEFVSKSKGCLTQVVPFTEDLDEVSEALFRLKVAGGDEFCGAAIDAATTDLVWSNDPSVYKTIVIAGNESFFQGETTFGEVLPDLTRRNIILNSIYCGTKYKDDDGWQTATEIAGGRFAKINHNHKLPNIQTPFDKMMRELNREMNDTFVWYGQHSHSAANNQRKQDANTARMSNHAFAARMSAKIGHLYHHVNHDLVDAMIHGKVNLSQMPEKLMPESLQAMTPTDRMTFLTEKIQARQSVRRRMADVIAKRHAFLHRKMMETLSKDDSANFGDALTQALVDQAMAQGFRFNAKLASSD